MERERFPSPEAHPATIFVVRIRRGYTPSVLGDFLGALTEVSRFGHFEGSPDNTEGNPKNTFWLRIDDTAGSKLARITRRLMRRYHLAMISQT